MEDLSINELLEQYVNGNRNSVIEYLANSHPCNLAFFLYNGLFRHGIGSPALDATDVRAITNRLLDMKVDQNMKVGE